MERFLPETYVIADLTNQPRYLPPGFVSGVFDDFPAIHHGPESDAASCHEEPVTHVSLEDCTTARPAPFHAEPGRDIYSRDRVILTAKQVAFLEAQYDKVKFPDLVVVAQCVRDIDLDEKRVRIWFRNRRAKDRKMNVGIDKLKEERQAARKYRRGRHVKFTAHQVAVMEALFASEHYPDALLRAEFAQQIGADVDRVTVWFERRRGNVET